MKVTILGCGASMGVPMVGNDWGDCDPSEPRNARSRSAILIEHSGKTILVDAGPELRMQLLAANVKHLDAAIITHEHADHTQGLDDLRAFAQISGRPLDIYSTTETINSLEGRFPYLFGIAKDGVRTGFLRSHTIAPDEGLPQCGIFTFPQQHQHWTSLGLRCDKFAYSTDVQMLDETVFPKLEGIDTWVVAALRRKPHVAHAPLNVVLGWIDRVAPRQAYLTHMNASMDYRTLLEELPVGVEPAYDGLVIDLAS